MDGRLFVFITQLGLSVAVPPVAFVLLAVWLRNRFQWGGWVIVAGVLLGVICAAGGLRSSLKAMEFMTRDKKKEKPPVAFNNHD